MISIELDVSEDSLKTIDQIASNMEVDRATVLREAFAHYLITYEQLHFDLAEGIRQTDAGETISHDELLARLEAVKRSKDHRLEAT